ncbi:MAG: heavy-metal-associated domain-containing protein [Bacteroidota bacterium]
METLKFKTNIKCGGCVATVSPSLNGAVGENNWQVDINNPEKTLTVSGTSASEGEIINAIKAAGFKAERTN